jgi:hypothetical protein
MRVVNRHTEFVLEDAGRQAEEIPCVHRVALSGGNFMPRWGPAGTISRTVMGTAWFRQLEASRILRVLVAVRWPRG